MRTAHAAKDRASRSAAGASGRAEMRARPRAESPAPGVAEPPAGIVQGLVALLLAAVFLVRIGSQASRAMFYTDECFHAHAAQWIAAHHRLPGVMPELYSGFYYYYPPLLHILGALWIGLAGVDALPLLNVGFTALLLALLAFGLPPRRPSRAGVWAALLCLSSRALGTHSVRFYVEALLALLMLCATLMLLRFWRTERMRDATWIGVAAGLALLTKQTALLMLPALVVLAALGAARREWRRAAGMAAALGVALLLALPMFVRNWKLFGDPIYPVFAPDVDRALYAMNVNHFAIPTASFHRQSLAAAGPLVVAAGVLALVLAAVRRRATLETVLVAGIALAFAAAARVPLADPRHLFPLIPALALLGALALSSAVGSRPLASRVAGIVLLACAALSVVRMPDYRAGLDVPPYLAEAYAAIRQDVPEGGTVLSLWTYDTFYYSRRSATWPIPWGQRVRYTGLFHEKEPARFLAALDSARIGYLLVPLWKPSEAFDGDNYPRSFIACVDSLGQSGRLRKLWESEWLMLVARVPNS